MILSRQHDFTRIKLAVYIHQRLALCLWGNFQLSFANSAASICLWIFYHTPLLFDWRYFMCCTIIMTFNLLALRLYEYLLLRYYENLLNLTLVYKNIERGKNLMFIYSTRKRFIFSNTRIFIILVSQVFVTQNPPKWLDQFLFLFTFGRSI